MFTQLSVCTYYFAFYFFFQIHISIHQQNPHTCVLKWCGAFNGSFQSPRYPGLILPSQVLFPTQADRPIPHPSLTTSLPTINFHYPSNSYMEFMFIWGWVLVRLCPSSHPLFLTIISLALFSKYIISIIPLYEKGAIPIYQMGTLRLRNIW